MQGIMGPSSFLGLQQSFEQASLSVHMGAHGYLYHALRLLSSHNGPQGLCCQPAQPGRIDVMGISVYWFVDT